MLVKKLLLALALLGLLCSCSKRSENTLVVGMELSYPPFEMTDTQGNPSGVSVDLAKALAAYLHKEVRIENIKFDGLIPSLKTGKIDCVISSMTANKERAKSIDFSDPYLNTGLSILLPAKSAIKSIVDVDRAGQRVTVKKATTGHMYATDHLKNADVVVLDEDSACALEVIQGKADAFLYDQMSIFQYWQKNRETTRALLEPFQKESWAIGIRKGNDALRLQVNAFLKEFREKKGFDELGDRYIKEGKQAFKEMGFPFYF